MDEISVKVTTYWSHVRPAPTMQATTRTTHSDGTRFEREASYARAVRIGTHVAVSGTAPIGPDGTLHPGDTYAQTVAAIEKALAAAESLGACRQDVIRTRLLLAPDAVWQEAARAHGEAFAGVDPANTTYFVAGFIPDVLVELELDAVLPTPG
jgi:enamine deaminase RidA (YjgF/YER057c/UK114 family)